MIWAGCDLLFQKFGASACEPEELQHLANTSHPVACKYADWLGNIPEVMLAVACISVFGPKTVEIYYVQKAKKAEKEKLCKCGATLDENGKCQKCAEGKK